MLVECLIKFCDIKIIVQNAIIVRASKGQNYRAKRYLSYDWQHQVELFIHKAYPSFISSPVSSIKIPTISLTCLPPL